MTENDIRVTVRKQNLKDIVEANLEQHRAMYAEAMDGYMESAREELQKALHDLEESRGAKDIHIHLQRPTDHSADYETLLGMLNHHTGDTLEIGADDFRRYAEDEWDWSRTWMVSNAKFSSRTQLHARAKGYL